MCELNVIEQVQNLCCTTVVGNAWERGQKLNVHGWIYGLSDGLIKDLDCSISSSNNIEGRYQASIEKAFKSRSETFES